jgi:hypothetical protein
MQILSMRLLALAAIAVLSLSGASFTKKAALPMTVAGLMTSAGATTAASLTTTAARQPSYYWYDPSDDQYLDYTTVAEEEFLDWVYFDAPVNTDPSGGYLVDTGYFDNSDPHDQPAVIYLYLHPND